MPRIKITSELTEKAELQIKEFQKQIEYDTKDYTIEHLVDKFNKQDFFIPRYQRKFVWRPKNKSMFIESVLLGLPIPFMFFAACDDGRLEIVDGAQRMQTLVEFVSNKLRLSNLEKLTYLNGFRFKDLTEAQQRKFNNKAFRVIVLDEKTTSDVRQDLFNRINTSGMKATDSEVRRGSYPGPLTTFIENCADNADFIRLCPVSTGKNLRQERFELILRFFAYLNNYQNFVHKVNGFLNDFLIDNMETFNEEQYQMEFARMLAFVDANFEFGFAKTQSASTTPRVRFEAISVGVALALREQPDLTVDNVDWINSEEFKHLTTSDASNNQNKLVGRIEYVRNILLGKLND